MFSLSLAMLVKFNLLEQSNISILPMVLGVQLRLGADLPAAVPVQHREEVRGRRRGRRGEAREGLAANAFSCSETCIFLANDAFSKRTFCRICQLLCHISEGSFAFPELIVFSRCVLEKFCFNAEQQQMKM